MSELAEGIRDTGHKKIPLRIGGGILEKMSI